MGGLQERRSLEFYLKRASLCPEGPILETWKEVRQRYCNEAYLPKFQKRHTGLSHDGTVSDELWAEIVKSINKDAGPGVDLCYEYKTNKDVLEELGEAELRKLVQERIKKRIDFFDFQGLSYLSTTEARKADALELVERGLVDPIRVFGKNEATKKTKMTRVINSVSLIDSCVERVSSLAVANLFSNDWMNSPSAVGIQLKDIDALIEFRRKTSSEFGSEDVEQDDVQGYEYSYRTQCMDVAHDIESWLDQGKFPDERDYTWTAVAKLRCVTSWIDKAPSVVVFSDGIVAVVDDSWLRSGKFVTAFHGTHVRSALVSIASSLLKKSYCRTPAKSNGDDCLSKFTGLDLTETYRSLGFVITDKRVSRGAEPWSFCSHLIFREIHYPESISKTTLNLLRNSKVTPELYDAFVFTNAFRPDVAEVMKFVLEVVSEAEEALEVTSE